ncbi:uncharacterized protein LOC123722718 [Papilio machaon]|uniref:uncharacterized protein LOC123722718 n=1 Tax=Papilio machaon TaxID=76193 RepID=UPI001E664085|nr:uncharacterized protein LOC123722718 [Papilio machaon]
MESTPNKQTTREGPACGESLGGSDSRPIGPSVYGGGIRRVEEEGSIGGCTGGSAGGSAGRSTGESVGGRFWEERQEEGEGMEVENHGAVAESDCSLITVESGPISDSSAAIPGAKRPRLSEGSTDEEGRTASRFRGKGRQLLRRAAAAAKEEDLIKEADIARFRRETRNKAFSQPGQGLNERHAAQLKEQVQEDLDIITKVATKSSNLKGTFVRALKDAAASIKEAVEVLGARTTTDETRQLQAANDRLKAEMADLRKELADLKEELRQRGSASSHPDVTEKAAPASRPSQGIPSVEEICRTVLVQVGGMMNARLASLEDRLLPERTLRPPLAADKKKDGRTYAATLSRQSSTPALGHQGLARQKAQQAIVQPGPSGVRRLVPPAPSQRPSGSAQSQLVAELATSSPPAVGNKGRKKKKKKKKKKRSPSEKQQSQPAAEEWRKVEPNKRAKDKGGAYKLRTPRSSAVVLTLQPGAVERGATYASVIALAKEKINPADFGAQGVRLRKAANGGRVFEFPGASSGDRADSLAQRLREVLGEEVVRVSRPTKSVALRVSGLDDSTTKTEVVAAVAAAGGCPAEQLRAGEVSTGRDGLGSVVIQCPVAAAKKVVTGGRILVGWVSAQVKLMDARPLMCYRCFRTGHISVQCQEGVDRTDLCFRCGQPGHKARGCSAALHCVVCAAAGIPAEHRVGSRSCVPPKGKSKGGGDGLSPVAGQSSSPPQQAASPGAEVVAMVEG